MPVIYSYPLVTSLSDSDLMLITSRDEDDELFTGSVKYETLKDSILSSFSGTDNYIPKFYQGAIVNSAIYQNGINIGIGTTSPSADLHVSNATGSVLRIDTEGGTNVDSVLNFRENSVDRASLYWDGTDNDLYLETTIGDIALMPSGNVGIGTANPNARLHVYNTGNGEIEVERASGALINIQAQSAKGVIGTDSNHTFSLKTNSSERLIILNSGNVGIGTNSPAKKLSVRDGGFDMFADGGTAADVFTVTTHQYAFNDENEDVVYSYDGTNGHEFSTQGTQQLYIKQNGNIGIGTNSPSQKLDVVGSIEVSDGIYVGGTAAANKLDDYEEGTFTPTIGSYIGGSLSPVYITQGGFYTKIGNICVASIYLVLDQTTTFSGSGALIFGGLPFPIFSTAGANSIQCSLNSITRLDGIDKFVGAAIGAGGSTTVGLQKQNPFNTSYSEATSFTTSDLQSGGNIVIRFSITYTTT